MSIGPRFFYHKFKMKHRSNHKDSHNKKISAMNITNFTIFCLWERIARDWDVIEWGKECQNVKSFTLIEAVLTLYRIFYDLSVTQKPLTKLKKNVKYVIVMALFFLNRERTCEQMFQLQFMIQKTRPIWHYPRHYTISQSRAICSQRPKCANLTPAGTHAF